VKTIPNKNKIQQITQQILILSDVNTISQVLKEIEQGKVLQKWRPMKGASKPYRHRKHKSHSCRDGLMHKEIIKIVHYFERPNFQPDYYTYSFGCHSRFLHGIFRRFIENNEQQILTFSGLQYTAGQKLTSLYTNLHFDSAQSAQDFCDLVLNSESFQLI
jgi:hypothetical protein